MTSVIFATTNQDKISEARSILKIEIEPLGLEIPEIQSLDPDQVAIQKAKDYFQKVGKPLFVEDVALTFRGLGALPGTYISDFSKTLGNDGLIKLLSQSTDRSAVALTTLAYINAPDNVMTFKGVVEGQIVKQPKGDGGFGWDPIFMPNGIDKTYAQMTPEEKNTYSMRRLALEKLAIHLKG